MALKWPGNEMKTVTHVYAHFVTHVFAPCREGKQTTARRGANFLDLSCGKSPQGQMALSHS